MYWTYRPRPHIVHSVVEIAIKISLSHQILNQGLLAKPEFTNRSSLPLVLSRRMRLASLILSKRRLTWLGELTCLIRSSDRLGPTRMAMARGKRALVPAIRPCYG